MKDQAQSLRMKMQQNARLGKSIAVVSGKGGVGKSNFTTNFSNMLMSYEKKVIIIDMDIGMGNVHILLGRSARYSLKDYLQGEVTLEEVIYDGPNNLNYVSGGTGLASILEWTDEMVDRLLLAFAKLQKDYDYILFDMGAGATNWSLDLLNAVDDIIVISTTEPTSITDAYSMMKYIHFKDREKNFYLLCNRVITNEEGTDTLIRLKQTMARFLSKDVTILGSLPEDPIVPKAVKQQELFTILYPNSKIAKIMEDITKRYIEGHAFDGFITQQPNKFISKLRSIFLKGRD
ncbi:MinD/ParA family protein [Rummeliibacillus sp. BSL5]